MALKKLNKTTTSLIIATYNWPEALKICLNSVVEQTILPDEVVIADDGSTETTKEVIESFKDKLNIIHVWHEDNGFRLSEIRNKAIDASSSEYVIQIDGDIILEKNFIKDHISNSRDNYFIVGSRVLLSKPLSEKIISTENTDLNFFTKGIANKANTLRIPFISPFLSKPTTNIDKVISSARGCNMSFWRQDLIDVNGYNQSMTGWGREDSELAVRLVNNGLIKKRIKLAGIQYHLFHKENDKSKFNVNDLILFKSALEGKIKCENGIVKIKDAKKQEKLNITAIIPTFNEEKKLEKALISVGFADEIIVVDSFSTDNTLKIAEKYATKILQREYENSASQKNWTIPQAKHEWIFLLDADEWITPALRKEIFKLYKQGFDKDAYWIYRNNYFMGRRIKYSGWQGDKVIRLFKKECRYENKHVHAEIITKDKKVGFLKNHIEHDTYTTLDNYISKLNRYAQWQAEDYNNRMGRITPFHVLLKPIFRFNIHYIVKLGILDGIPGFTISVLQAYAVMMRYIKLWLYRKNMQ